MKKITHIGLWMIVIMLILSTITYGWFSYVQRKSVATFVSNDIDAVVSINDEVINETLTLSNLAFIDFENDFIDDKNQALNDIAQEMRVSLTLDANSPLSRFLFDIVVNQDEIIYVIILDEEITDYYLFVAQFIESTDTKEDILNKIDLYNTEQIITINNQIVYPDETVEFVVVFWADYEQLENPSLYQDFQAEVYIDLRIVSAYGDVS
jgi:hypothetical protein